MKIDILRNYKPIPITELKIGTFGIVVETPSEYKDYLNKLALAVIENISVRIINI